MNPARIQYCLLLLCAMRVVKSAVLGASHMTSDVRTSRAKWYERHDGYGPAYLRAGHESLVRLVPAQGELDFLTLSDSSKRSFPDELPFRLKKNRYNELLRVGYSLEDQEGLHL